ncbi:MAG: hypothetical protein EON60_14295 [Alphaproteobacteria bacterium]|nr:MAG: hypothetical protein EON60_14295 [Alphaproteobacteria bacterium]
MESGFGTLIYLLIGYVCGVLFIPETVSANFMATDWYNVWTYAWLLGWPIMLPLHLLAPAFTAAPAVVVTTTP